MTRPAAVAFVGAVLIYGLLLLISIALLSIDSIADGPARIPVALLPVPAAVAIVVLAVRRYQSVDELAQRIHLMALAVAFLGTLLVAFTWGFLEGIDVPRLSGFVYFGILVALYLIGLWWARRRYA